MKIFLDTADVSEIKKAYSTGLIDGVTTNPTLILRSGDTLYNVASRLLKECPNFISVSTEVVAETADVRPAAMPSGGPGACNMIGHIVTMTIAHKDTLADTPFRAIQCLSVSVFLFACALSKEAT